jgi:outer membrane protein TolC
MRSLIYVLLLLLPLEVHAQSLEEYLRAARDGGGLELAEARATRGELEARVDEARARLLPSIQVSASYTRNQFEAVAEFPTFEGGVPTGTQQAVITPFDQLEARFALVVPIIDASAWSGFLGAEQTAAAASERERAIGVDTEASVITAYYSLVASRAVRDAAERTLATSEENVGVVSSRVDAGLGSELDRQRAIADVERARQSVAEAELAEAIAARNLYVTTGLAADISDAALDDELAPEDPLEQYTGTAEQQPGVRAAELDVRAARHALDAAWLTLVPTVSATASERLTNATGFNAQSSAWAVGVSATWILDLGRPAAISARDRQLEAALLRRERAERTAQTAIIEAWHRVRSSIARARASRAALEASTRAAEVARARFSAGTGTQLEVSQSERDLFAAEVARIQADADLRVARHALRLRSGREASR